MCPEFLTRPTFDFDGSCPFNKVNFVVQKIECVLYMYIIDTLEKH